MHFLKVEEGEKIPEAIDLFLDKHNISSAFIMGIGGFEEAIVAHFDREKAVYKNIDVKRKYPYIIEVASLIGNSVYHGTKYYTHLHVVLGVDEKNTIAGHLVEAKVNPFLELMVIDASDLHKEFLELLSHRWLGLK